MRNLNNKSKNVISDNYFSNVNFSITKAHTDFKFRLLCLHTHLKGTVSQIFCLGLSFYCMAKIGKHFINFVNIISKSHKTKTRT